jgi:hypothetical protein
MAAITRPQRFLQSIVPSGLFESLEAGTRTFMFECPCGHARDLWEAGGLKRAGTGQYSWAACQVSGQRTCGAARSSRFGLMKLSALGLRNRWRGLGWCRLEIHLCRRSSALVRGAADIRGLEEEFLLRLFFQ